MAKTSGSRVVPAADEVLDEYPLFFKKPVALDASKHAKAGITPEADFSFALNSNSIIVNGIEFYELSKFYPIVFTEGESPIPAVVVGLENDNYFVGDKGQWKEATYIPAYVRKYPFAFMDFTDSDSHVLCIDEKAPQFKASGGKNTLGLFKAGEPTDVTKHALQFCAAYHQDFQLTDLFCREMAKAELLVPMRFDVKLHSGRDLNIGGFQIIDEKKLQALPDKTIVEFFKHGWMPLIYASLISHSNWKILAEMAGNLEKTKAN